LKAYDEDTVTLEMEDETEMQFKRSDIARNPACILLLIEQT